YHYSPSTLVFSVSAPPTLLLTLFFFNHTATPEIYTLSLHDALPISATGDVSLRTADANAAQIGGRRCAQGDARRWAGAGDRRPARGADLLAKPSPVRAFGAVEPA